MSAADSVTPIVLTLDEEDNLERTLSALDWADRVLVVDSGSTDRTEAIARAHCNVRFDRHPFEDFGAQWRYAMVHPDVRTTYVLALDADMIVPPTFVREAEERFLGHDYAGGRFRFRYAVGGRVLMGSLFPADVRLFLRSVVRPGQRGHRHVFDLEGPIYHFRAPLLHDDRKPFSRFIASQVGYAANEQAMLARGSGRLRDRMRRSGWMPPLMFLLAWLSAGGPLRGRAALRYGYERSLYEMLLAMRLMRSETGEVDAE